MNTKICGVQKEFDTYIKAVLVRVIRNILRELSNGNEHRLEKVYLEDLLYETVIKQIVPEIEKSYLKLNGKRYSFDDEYLVKALKRLPKKNRTIIVLLYSEGLPIDEVAENVGLSLDVTYNRKSRSLRKLRKFILEEKNGKEEL